MAYSNLQIFTVELVGTFILVVFATGSIVYDAEFFDGRLGIPFAAVAPFVALLIGVYSFGKISLAHFNPAVTIGYYITGHISKIQIVYYFAAEIIGAILGSLFVLMKNLKAPTVMNIAPINTKNANFSKSMKTDINIIATPTNNQMNSCIFLGLLMLTPSLLRHLL